VGKFNTKNPTYYIDSDNIFNSVLKQSELRQGARRGVNVTEKNAVLFDEALSIAEKQAEKERKK
jgi:hypothetical protein